LELALLGHFPKTEESLCFTPQHCKSEGRTMDVSTLITSFI
jgi:hypothetical protein